MSAGEDARAKLNNFIDKAGSEIDKADSHHSSHPRSTGSGPWNDMNNKQGVTGAVTTVTGTVRVTRLTLPSFIRSAQLT